MPKTEDPTITVGELREALSAYRDSDKLSFSGLTYYDQGSHTGADLVRSFVFDHARTLARWCPQTPE